MKTVIYFNQWFSSISDVIADIKDKHPDELYIIGSSRNPNHVYKDVVDEFIVEDWEEVEGDLEQTKKNYVDWVCTLCYSYKVDFFFVKKHATWIAERAADFIVRNVRLINENIELLNKMQSKAYVYDILKVDDQVDWIVPHYLHTSNKREIEVILSNLSTKNPWCFKLDEDEGGASFRKIDSSQVTLDTLSKFRVNTVSKSEALGMLTYLESDAINKLIYMEILDEPEISVDCYDSDNGFIAICREKIAGTRIQRLFYNKEIYAICNRLKDIFGFKFPFNVQFRTKHGTDSKNIDNLRLLEINPRMSGGTYYQLLLDLNMAEVCLLDLINQNELYDIKKYTDFECQVEHIIVQGLI